MKKIFITGVSGFAGSFLAEELLKNSDNQVFGTYISEKGLDNLVHIKDKIKGVALNLLNKEKTQQIIKDIKPDVIFHLAALTSPSESFDKPSEVITNNVEAEISVLESVRKIGLLNCRILITSSAEIYGMVDPASLPINENAPLRPSSPYAVSKIAQDFLGLQYSLSYKMNIVRIRPFNHIGPRQSPGFVVSAFAKKIAEIEKEIKEPILTVGNLESKRDFTDVRDMVKAYILLGEKGIAGEVYNVGCGQSYKISDILEKLLSFSEKKIKVTVDKSLFRPSDTPDLYADNSKIIAQTGWAAQIPLEQSLKDTLDYWRSIL